MPHATMWEHIYTEWRLLYPCGLPCSWRMVWCGLQCTAPMAFPAQLFHRPWRTQVAVMTEDARLVALHSLDTVAPIVAPSPARPLTKARICRADIWSFQIFFKQVQEKEKKWKLLQADKLHCGHVFHWDDLQTRHLAWSVMDTGIPEWNSKGSMRWRLVIIFCRASFWNVSRFGLKIKASITLTQKTTED